MSRRPLNANVLSLVLCAGAVCADSPIRAAPASAPIGTDHCVCVETFPDAASAEDAVRLAIPLAADDGLGTPEVLSIAGQEALCLSGFKSAAQAFASGAQLLSRQPLRSAGVVSLSFTLQRTSISAAAAQEALKLDETLAATLGGVSGGLPAAAVSLGAQTFVAPLPDSWVPDAAQAVAVLPAGAALIALARVDSWDGPDCLSWYLTIFDAGVTGYELGYVMTSNAAPVGASPRGGGDVHALVQPAFRAGGLETDMVLVERGGAIATTWLRDLPLAALPLVLSWDGHQPVVKDATGAERYRDKH